MLAIWRLMMPALIYEQDFKDKWANPYPLIQEIVVIAITRAEALSSPSYDLGTDTSQLPEHWLRHYAIALGSNITKQVD